MRKLSLWTAISLLCVFCAATTIASPAQAGCSGQSEGHEWEGDRDQPVMGNRLWRRSGKEWTDKAPFLCGRARQQSGGKVWLDRVQTVRLKDQRMTRPPAKAAFSVHSA